MTDVMAANSLSELEKAEFVEFVARFFEERDITEDEENRQVRHFDRLVPHPQKNGLIFWPPEGVATPIDVAEEVERYCLVNGLPAFKDSPRGTA
jgi:hypothetical protein